MKQAFILTILALLIVSSLAMVSAGTLIAGKIYDSPNFETANGVEDANINVTCGSNLRNTTSLTDGTYSVIFSIAECPLNSNVTVVAEKYGISNSETGIVHDYSSLIVDLYIGVVNIVLIPEFGLFVGALTIISAVGIFFFVRKH